MARQRHGRKRIEALLLRRERLGLTFAELSRRSGVSVPTLSWWASKLRREAGGEGRRFVEVLPVGEDDERGSARVEIVLRNGRQLVVREAITREALRGLLEALESPC